MYNMPVAAVMTAMMMRNIRYEFYHINKLCNSDFKANKKYGRQLVVEIYSIKKPSAVLCHRVRVK